ncbi:unnamed protein product [Amoebophrya sp. A120]|nr:unnamed protein product [Amoebophrya sp. A120]|eukprot:GSA120T00003344001.1
MQRLCITGARFVRPRPEKIVAMGGKPAVTMRSASSSTPRNRALCRRFASTTTAAPATSETAGHDMAGSQQSRSSTSSSSTSQHRPRPKIRKGHVKPPLPVPDTIVRPFYATNAAQGYAPQPLSGAQLFGERKTADEVRRMRVAAEVASSALVALREHLHSPEMLELARDGKLTTSRIDEFVQSHLMARSAYPVGIRFHGFPRGCCTSVNEVVVHGVPDDEPLQLGDIVNVDVSCFVDGMYGDTSKMFAVGGPSRASPEARALCRATRDALYRAVEACKPGVRVDVIGKVITEVAKAKKYGVVREFTGHFIGKELHMPPFVLHVPNDQTLTLQPGMTFTIEPILTAGGSGDIEGPWEDGWTFVTKDGSLSAQMEHTALITETGHEILTESALDTDPAFVDSGGLF